MGAVMASLYDVPRFYDLLYHPGVAERYYVDACTRRGGRVLELACGTGRVTLPLARAGLDVVGVDLAPSMLDVARQGAIAAGLRIELLCADMTSVTVAGPPFDTIVIAHNSLQHLHESAQIVACFERVRAHLAPGGVLLFDVFAPSVQLLARDPTERKRFGEFVDTERGPVVVDHVNAYDAVAQVVRSRIFFSSDAAPDFHVVDLALRCIFPQELPLLIERAGLALAQRYGDFEGAPFGGSSVHQVCVARPV